MYLHRDSHRKNQKRVNFETKWTFERRGENDPSDELDCAVMVVEDGVHGCYGREYSGHRRCVLLKRSDKASQPCRFRGK